MSNRVTEWIEGEHFVTERQTDIVKPLAPVGANKTQYFRLRLYDSYFDALIALSDCSLIAL